jgi:hypothetical protein
MVTANSERVFWRKVLYIHSTSIDYDPTSAASTLFFEPCGTGCRGGIASHGDRRVPLTRYW